MKQRDRSTWNCRRVQILNDEGYEVMEVMQDTWIDTTPGDVCYRWNRPKIHPHWRGYDVQEWEEYATTALLIARRWLPDVTSKAQREAQP